MKRKKEVALLLLTAVLAAAGCADEKTTGEKTTESGSAAAVSGSSVFDGELEENVTIRVLENDTAISKGFVPDIADFRRNRIKQCRKLRGIFHCGLGDGTAFYVETIHKHT